MRRLAFVTFTATTALSVAAGTVLAFGAAHRVSGSTQTGDAAVAISGYQPVVIDGATVALDDNGQPEAVATATLANDSSGQGQQEDVSGTVTDIVASAPSQPTQGDTAACNQFISAGGVTGTILFPSATGFGAPSAVLAPPASGSAATTSFQVTLAMQPNPLDADGASVCSDQQLTFDVILTSALPN